MKEKYNIVIPENIYPRPNIREISAAYILAKYFKTNIEFIPRGNQRTPDFLINNLYWELKTPTGTGKYNLQHTLRSATKQSENIIIIDARFSKMNISKIRNELNYQFKKSQNIKRLLLIDKQKRIVDFCR